MGLSLLTHEEFTSFVPQQTFTPSASTQLTTFYLIELIVGLALLLDSELLKGKGPILLLFAFLKPATIGTE